MVSIWYGNCIGSYTIFPSTLVLCANCWIQPAMNTRSVLHVTHNQLLGLNWKTLLTWISLLHTSLYFCPGWNGSPKKICRHPTSWNLWILPYLGKSVSADVVKDFERKISWIFWGGGVINPQANVLIKGRWGRFETDRRNDMQLLVRWKWRQRL